MDSQPGRIVRFGVFEMDTASAELRKSGVRLRLQEQPARVLLHLLEHRGEIVTREQLHRALWPEDTFVDFDQGLNTAVNKIRDALGDSAVGARFIETVPKKGYRFVAQVEEVAAGAPQVAPLPVSLAQSKPRSLRWLWGGGGLAVASVAVAALLASRWSPRGPEPSVVPLTTLPGSEWTSSLSPDGERVAFTWGGPSDANFDIYVKQIGSEHLLRLTSDTAVDGNPAWSPDGRWIAFSRQHPDKPSELFVTPAMGGAETKLTEFFAGPNHHYGQVASWGPNGKWMVIMDRTGPDRNVSSLYSLSLDSREKRRLTSPPDASLGDTDPAVSPDGRSVAFIRRYSDQLNAMYLLQLTGDAAPLGAPALLLPNTQTYRSPTWTVDGREIVVQSGWLHLPMLSRLRLGEESPARMDFTGEFAGFPSISRNGTRMSFRRGRVDINIWALNLATPGNPQSEPWNASSTYLDHVPCFSPDGRHVAFISNRLGSQALWVSDADGSRARRVTNFPDAQVGNCSWTADGSALVILVLTGKGAKAFTVGVNGGSPIEISYPGHDPSAFIQSRDGKSWFFALKKTGRSEIWKAPLDGGSQVQVTGRGGYRPQESPDGKYIYYSAIETNNSLWRVPVNGGTEEKVLESLATPMSFQVMDEGIYYIPKSDADGRSAIRLHRFATGKSEVLAPLDKMVMWGFSVSPDRKTILYVQVDGSSHDLMLMENFR